ncbi:hypothetical protein FOA52_013280 [Chlamydomonas sp. UWO 241]|nr:hypothetical protein FOA52_013280 [Chlamydomonas sp. UWO 241]
MPQKRRGSAVIPLLPLLLTVILLLVCPRDAIAQETQPEPEPEDIGCNEIPFYPIEDHCALTRNCSFEHRIPWHKLYYCYVEPEGISAKAPFLVMLAFLFLPIMLLILMDAAVMFFSPNVSIIAQLTNMRPRVAGVTLLAIGNVAPDISSGVLAMVSGSPSLALGAIVGAGCFVQMIVLSQVIITAGSAKCSLGMVRIIATYAVGAAILLIYLCIGQWARRSC